MAPPNLWWVEEDEGERSHWAYPVVSIEHYYSDSPRHNEDHETVFSQAIYMMRDGTSQKCSSSTGQLVYASTPKEAIDFINYV